MTGLSVTDLLGGGVISGGEEMVGSIAKLLATPAGQEILLRMLGEAGITQAQLNSANAEIQAKQIPDPKE